MGKINSAVDEGTRILLREIKKSHKNGVIRLWKKRKVISIAKWNELIKSPDSKNLGYIPEDHVDGPWIYVPKDKSEESQRDEWYKDWQEYLYEKQKPSYGEYLCRRCILHHESGEYNSSIRDLAILGLDMSVKHPCDTENIFKCPFLPKGPSVQLFDMQEILKLVIDSLGHAQSLSMYNKQTAIVYFNRNFVEEYFDHYHRKPSGWGSLAPTLEIFEISDVMVDSIQDIYNVLTSDKLLTVVIDQHIRDIRNPPGSRIEYADYLETIKPKAISYFRSIRKKIKIADIRDFSGRNLEEEREFLEVLRKTFKPKNEELLLKDIPRSGLCIECQGFANINCADCDIWVCTKHMKAHATDVHGYKITK